MRRRSKSSVAAVAAALAAWSLAGSSLPSLAAEKGPTTRAGNAEQLHIRLLGVSQ